MSRITATKSEQAQDRRPSFQASGRRIHIRYDRTLRLEARLVWSYVPLATGTALWVWSANRLSLNRVGDLGLLTVLPVSYWLALALVLLGTAMAIWSRELREIQAAIHVAFLVLALYGAAGFASTYPRGTVPWRHVGIAAQIQSSAQVDARIDAYFGWPGFFGLLASWTGVSGLTDSSVLMTWAPVANNLLFLLPMLVLARVLTVDRRLAWSGIVLFYLANWVDQDYLAPQALGFFLYLCVLALLLTFFRRRERLPTALARLIPTSWLARTSRIATRADDHGRHEAVSAGRGSVIIAVALSIAAVVASHQLTPFSLLLALVALRTLGATSVRGLGVLTGTMIVAWLAYPAAPYMEGHLGRLLAQVGDVAGAAQGGLVQRVQGSDGHLLVIRARIAFSTLLWALGAAGALRLWWRTGLLPATAAALVVAPGFLFGLQSYGVEMLLRIFLFSLPFTCLLAAHLLPWSRGTTSRRRAGALFLVVTLLMTPAFVLVRYGNQLIDQRGAAEVEGVRALYELAPAGSLLIAGNENTPWRNQEYADHRHRTLSQLGEEGPPEDVSALAVSLRDELLASEPAGFLLLTRQQQAYEELLGRRTPWTLAEVEASLLRRSDFRVVFQNEDALILAPVEAAAT